MDDRETQWVHESNYGSPAFGGVIVGISLIVWAVVLGLAKLFQR